MVVIHGSRSGRWFLRLGHVEHSAQGGGTGPVDVLAFRSHPRCGVVGETLRFSGADTSRAGDATAFDPLERATVAMGSGGGRGEDGGGSGASGAARRTPPTPRLSTFLRTFGTTLAARAGVDVDAEYVSRRAILDARLSTAGSSSSSFSSSSSGARGTATAPLARSVCGPGVAPDRDARDALEAFLQAVVRVSGGDTLLPDQLADASLAAFDAVANLCVSSAAADARCIEEAAYARDPDLVRRRGEAESREWTRKKKKALAAAVGPIADQHFPAFERAAHALAAMREERDVRDASESERDEFGADWDVVPPGTGAFTNPLRDRRLHNPLRDRRLHNHRRLEHTPRGFDAGGVDARGFSGGVRRRGSSSTRGRGGVRGRRLPSGRRRRRRGFRRSRGGGVRDGTAGVVEGAVRGGVGVRVVGGDGRRGRSRVTLRRGRDERRRSSRPNSSISSATPAWSS